MAFLLHIASVLAVAVLARALSISSAHLSSSLRRNVAVRLAAVPEAPLLRHECFRNGDCPLTHSCSYRILVRRPWCGLESCTVSRCVPLLGVGRLCGGNALACPGGQFCLGTVADPRPRCTPKKAWGGVCWMGLPGNCMNLLKCVRTQGNWGICAPTLGKPKRRVGQQCEDHGDCDGLMSKLGFRAPVCNKDFSSHAVGYGMPGICALPGTLISKPGVPCDPGRDLCDRRRGLRCERSGARHVCVQRSVWNGECTPGSPFSSCSTAAAGTELECRRGQTIFTKVPRGTFRCYYPKETVPVGALCVEEHTVCERGSSCVHASDLKTFTEYNDSPIATAYCMRTVPPGGDCSTRFFSKCAQGSACVKGTCRKGAKADPLPTLAGIKGICKSLSCARGLHCDAKFYPYHTCIVRPVYAGPWARCAKRYYNWNKNIICVKGTHCTRALEWRGIKRCRPAGGVGAFCENDVACEGALKCGKPARGDVLKTRLCYDPRTAIPTGVACDPKNSNCVV